MLALACMAAASAATEAPAQCGADGLFPGAIEMRDTLIPSEGLAGSAVPFGAVLVPAGWMTEGGMTVAAGLPCQSSTQLSWRAQSPDQLSGVVLLPEASWVYVRPSGTKFSNCPDRPYGDAWTYLPELLKGIQPAAVPAEVHNRHDLAAPVSAQWQGAVPQANPLAVSAGELPFQVPALGEAPARDGLLVAIVVTVTTAPEIPENQTTAYAYPALLAFAPPGQLDPALVEAMRASAVTNPVWVQALERATRIGMPPEQPPLSTKFEARREAAAAAPACERGLRPLTIPNLWIAADGRYYFKEMPSP